MEIAALLDLAARAAIVYAAQHYRETGEQITAAEYVAKTEQFLADARAAYGQARADLKAEIARREALEGQGTATVAAFTAPVDQPA